MKSFDEELNSVLEDNDVIEMSSEEYANNLKAASEEPSRGTLKGAAAKKFSGPRSEGGTLNGFETSSMRESVSGFDVSALRKKLDEIL